MKDEEIVNRDFFAPLLFLKVEKKSFYDNPEGKEGLFAGIASLSGSQLKDLLTKKITKTKNKYNYFSICCEIILGNFKF